jgi:hypothetical protein
MEALQPEAGQAGSRRRRYHGVAVQVRQRTANVWRWIGVTIAACLRTSTDAMGRDAKSGQRAARGVPWPGLVLWAFACIALFVSLIMRADEVDHDRRVAARSAATEQILDGSHPVHRLTRQASELSLFSARRPPPR